MRGCLERKRCAVALLGIHGSSCWQRGTSVGRWGAPRGPEVQQASVGVKGIAVLCSLLKGQWAWFQRFQQLLITGYSVHQPSLFPEMKAGRSTGLTAVTSPILTSRRREILRNTHTSPLVCAGYSAAAAGEPADLHSTVGSTLPSKQELLQHTTLDGRQHPTGATLQRATCVSTGTRVGQSLRPIL